MTDHTYPVTPGLLLVACVIAALVWLNTRAIEAPPVRKGTGPQWADGELVTIAATGEIVAWRRD